ncbi:unnamed protein product [Aphanomyces euteiches]
MATTTKGQVFPVNLRRASQLAGISYEDLVSGMHPDDAMRMQGVYIEVDDDNERLEQENDDAIAFEGQLDALLLTSTRTTAFGIPLDLQQLEGKSILEHSLLQLHLAGIDRVVLAVTPDSECRAHIEASSVCAEMTIVFLEVTSKVLESIPETVMAARHSFSSHFVIHAPNRVFHKDLLLRLDACHRRKLSACFLIEADRSVEARMDSSKVRVQCTPQTADHPPKIHVGRDIPDYTGVDVGLYVVSNKIFLVLDQLLDRIGGLSFPESLAFGFQKIQCLAVGNSIWFGVDSVAQMVHAIETNVLKRFAVSTAPPERRRKSIILSTDSSQNEANLQRRSSCADKIEPFQAFVVDVKSTSLPHGDEAEPLLMPRRLSIKVANESTAEMISTNEMKLTLPPGSADNPHSSAYLIQRPSSAFVLAVPDNAKKPRMSMIRRLSALPSDIKEVSLEAAVVDGKLAVQLTVQKQVPPIGYVILIGALLSVSSQGAALETLAEVPALLKMVWRYFGSSLLFGALTLLTTVDSGGGAPPLTFQVVRDAIVCTAAYVIFSSTFIWALDHTSVGHAYIFSNSHSLLLVFGKCLMGESVASMELSGAMLGLLGGVITSQDHGGDATGAHNPAFQGDAVAFLGAVGGVVYLLYATALREIMGIWLFCFYLFTGTWVMLLPFLWALHVPIDLSTDPIHGFFGWVHYLGIEIVLVVIVSACGAMGFVSAMKYFPPIVVSVTMLLEPVVATAICIFFGMASLPGILTFIGGSAVIGGTFLVIWSTSNSTETTNVTEAMELQAVATPKGYGTCSS